MTDKSISNGDNKSACNAQSTKNGCNLGSMDVESVGERSEFVVVSDRSGESMELPTASDNSLFMSTLQSTYPGATGLKYKNPTTGALRAVAVDATGMKLLPPADGWDDKVFMVITPNVRSDRGSDVSVKRRKIGTSDGESDSDGEGRVGRKRTADDRDTAGIGEPILPRRPVDLIVLGVDYKTTDEAFKKYFEAYGTVTFAEIKKTAEGKSKGFGFVQMSTMEEQNKVLATAHVLDGRRCTVQLPEQKIAHGRGGIGRDVALPKTQVNKIFVGRLAEKITEETLRKFFDKEAKQIIEGAMVTDVYIPRPFRGFAFITFTHPEVAERLVRANNFVIDDMSVVVTRAIPHEKQQQGGVAPTSDDSGYDYGYSQGPDYGASPGVPFPFPPREVYGYSPPTVYPHSPYDGWVSSPTALQGTPRSSRGTPAQEQQWSQHHPAQKSGPAAAYAGPQKMPKHGVPSHLSHHMYAREGSAGQAASNQIASGLDALNLNQKNPELLNAAWNAFFKTLNQAGASPQSQKKW